ncbi:hypothetical protein MBLNU459_g5799t2 [Dothideomycetes sp. NU459]
MYYLQTRWTWILQAAATDSIKNAAGQIAADMMNYYTGFGEMVEYWYYTGDSTYNAKVVQALLHQIGSDQDYMPANQSKSLGNDDQVFWAFAVMSAAELKFENPPSGQPSWLALAQAVFNEQASRWDTTACAGGLRWQVFTFNAGYDYKNTISNGGFFQLSARLARYTQNETYTAWANKTWDWFASTPLLNEETWQVNDGSSTEKNCTDASLLQWTYNYGTWIAGAAYLYNHTEDEIWLTRLDGLLNRTIGTFFPASMGDNIMVEVTCEPIGNCDVDQPSFKAYLSRWLAVAAQLVPQYYERIFTRLRASAKGAAGQCSGGADGRTCGRRWNSTTWDGTSGVGEQMSALGVVQAMLIDATDLAPPVGSSTGGTSQGDPSAGTGTSSGGGSKSGDPAVNTRKMTTKDKAGAGFLTALFLIITLGGGAWLVFE